MKYIVIVGTKPGHGRPDSESGEWDSAQDAIAWAKGTSLRHPGKIVTVVDRNGNDVAYYRTGAKVYGNAVAHDKGRRPARRKTVKRKTRRDVGWW